MRLLLIADNDSQLLACEALCLGSGISSDDVTINVIPRDGTPETILRRVRPLGTFWTLQLPQLLSSSKLNRFDAIGVFLTGSKLNDIRLALERRSKRPLLFCGFNGVVLDHFIEGISWRLGYDLICLGGPRDQEALAELVANTPFANQRTVLTGLQRNQVSANDPQTSEKPKQMVFAEQVVMPATAGERAIMVRILADLADRSPDWKILIKPRISPGDATFHEVETHISTTVRQTLGVPPRNLDITYRPLPDLLRETRLLVTLSSTAFFDALDFGCRPMAMSDLGLNSAYGSHVFVGSGVWRCISEITDLNELDRNLPFPDQRWLQWMGYGPDFNPRKLLSALEKMEAAQPSCLETGYPASRQSSFYQLRLGAEAAIATGDWHSARELLSQASQMRPHHRGVARRLATVTIRNPWLRRLGLMLSYRYLR